MTAAARTRLFVPDALASGGGVVLADDQAHYLRHVLRLGEGEPVALFNGRDGEYRAVIVEASKKSCRLQIEAKLRDFAPASDVWLCFAPIRQGRIELIVEKATELGIGRLLPVLTKRTQIAKVNTERLTAQAREAAEQSERLDVPEIAAAVSLEKLLTGWPAERTLFFCQERGAAMPLLKAAAAVQTAPCALLVGPEGGFAPEEMTLINDTPGAVAVSLGSTILRAETAAIAALAILQAARQN